MLLARWLFHPRLIGLIDQGTLGVIRFATVVVLARSLAIEDFGVIALAISTTYFISSIQRAMVGVPFVRQCPDEEALGQTGGTWFYLSCLLALVCGVIFALVAVVLWGVQAPAWAYEVAAVLSVAAPATWLYEFERRWLHQWRNHKAVLVQAIVLAATTAACLLAVFFRLHSTFGAILALTVPYLVAMLAGFVMQPPARADRRALTKTLRESWGFSRWMLADATINLAHNTGMQFWIAAATGPGGAAIFTAARNLVAPVMTLISAIEVSEMPRMSAAFASAGRGELNRKAKQTLGFMLLLIVPFLIVILVPGQQALDFVYGAKYSGHVDELRLWGVIVLLLTLIAPLEMALLISSDSKQVFRARTVAAICTIAIASMLIGRYGVTGGLAAIACGTCILLAGLMIAALRRNAAPARAGAFTADEKRAGTIPDSTASK